MLRANVNEVNVQPVDLGHELRQGVQPRLDLAPVVLGRPVARELLHRRERHTLRLICDGLLFGPLRGLDPSTEVVEGLLRNVDVEGTDFARALDGGTHEDLRGWSGAVRLTSLSVKRLGRPYACRRRQSNKPRQVATGRPRG